MMKNGYKFLSFFALLGMIIFATSCGDDDGGIIIDDDDDGDGGTTFQVADGLYLAGLSGEDTVIVNATILNDAQVEGEGFAPTDRDGHKASFMHLTSGTYFFAEVEDQSVTSAFGGTASVVDSTGTTAGKYIYVETSATGSSFTVGEEGFYHVIYDATENESYLIKITSWGVIGGGVYESTCVSNGFNSDIDLVEVSVSADGGTWTGEDIIIRAGTYKFRYNDTWTIGSYKSFTNFGGATISALSAGGANIDNATESIYDVTFSLSADGVPSATLTDTGVAPDECTFDPDNFQWGIIGSATEPDEWASHKKLTYAGQDGSSHIWRGVFPLDDTDASNEFKFRADDGWVTKLTPGTETAPVTITDNTEAGFISDNTATTPADASWFAEDVAGGFIYVIISTDDFGVSWNLTLDEAEFQFIGEGSPVGNWDAGNGIALTYNDDLASVTGTGAFTTAGWKVYVNQSFDYNLGGATDGTTALEFNNSTFSLSAAGTYTVTISTADGGVTYTATATQ